MKRTHFLTINSRKIVTNLIIVLLVASISLMAAYGVNVVTTSTIINGVYYRGDEEANKVTLMINVYWGTEYLDEMLEILEENDVKTTFFVGGTWAVKESDMLKKIYEAGHEIGNHGYYHKDQGKLSSSKNHEEIINTHTLVKSILGIDMNLFAPPSGSYNSKTVEVASELGYKTIMWTDGRDTIDWRDKDSNVIYERAVKNCKSGDLILMHPTLATKDALDRIIKTIKGQGFTLTTVSDNISQI